MKKSVFTRVSYIITIIMIIVTIISALLLNFIDFSTASKEYYAWFEPLLDVGKVLFSSIALVAVAVVYMFSIFLLILSQLILLIIGIVKTKKNKDINYGHVIMVNSISLILSSLAFIMEFII